MVIIEIKTLIEFKPKVLKHIYLKKIKNRHYNRRPRAISITNMMSHNEMYNRRKMTKYLHHLHKIKTTVEMVARTRASLAKVLLHLMTR